MEAMDFDALVYKNQGFNTLDNFANSAVTQQMSQQTLQNIQQHKSATPLFFVALNGQQKGPLTLEQLKGLAVCDIIDENSPVWMQGMADWTDLKTCLSQLKLK